MAANFSSQPRPVGQRDLDPVRMTHEVVVRDDQTRRINDEAGAGSHRLFTPVTEAAAKFAAKRDIAQFRG